VERGLASHTIIRFIPPVGGVLMRSQTSPLPPPLSLLVTTRQVLSVDEELQEVEKGRTDVVLNYPTICCGNVGDGECIVQACALLLYICDQLLAYRMCVYACRWPPKSHLRPDPCRFTSAASSCWKTVCAPMGRRRISKRTLTFRTNLL
jgi:hypothetical protein